MKKIKIKRATGVCLVECEGILLEVNGFQFCVVNDKINGKFYCIELYTGGSVVTESIHRYSRKAFILKAENYIENKTKKEILESIKRYKECYNDQYSFLINKKIKTS